MFDEIRVYEGIAERKSAGLAVSLLWNRADDSLLVAVNDETAQQSFALAVGRDAALDVFYHPYAYASFAAQGGDGASAAASPSDADTRDARRFSLTRTRSRM